MAQWEALSKKNALRLLALLLLLVIMTFPTPAGLSVQGQRAIAIFAMAILLWATGAIPLSVTGLLVMAALPVLGVMNEKMAYSLFGNPAVFFILGAFILAAAMMKTGLSMRLSLLVLERFGGSPKMLVAGVLLTSSSMAFFMPEHAVAAILFPVVVDIASALELEPLRSRYGALLFLSLAWGSVIGGIATLLGGARGPLAMGLLTEHYGTSISFFYWILVAAPMTFVLLAICYALLLFFFRIDVKDVSKARLVIHEELKEKGAFTKEERKVLAVMILTFLSWVFLSNRFGLANIALLASVSLFVMGVIEWKDVEDYVNWGVILMYGGAIAVGSALVSTGAVQWLVDIFLENGTFTPLTFLLAFSFIAIFLTEGVSNAAVVAILLPLGFGVGEALGINPVATVFIIALPSGLAFIFPISSPPNAIAYSSGYYEVSDVIKPGLILNIVSWITLVAMALLYWPMVGLSIA